MVVVEQSLQETRSTEETKPKRYAVVVGINDYTESGIGDLNFCVADAETFYDALLTYCEYDPECIVLFSDSLNPNAKKPFRSDILAAIVNMCKSATKEDSVLFFFAGHGTRDQNDSYLLTHEYRPQVVADTGISMDTINGYILDSEARFKMRFFDACHSGRITSRATPTLPDVKKHFLVEADGWLTLSACREDQYAYEDPVLGHGIFSYCLVKGMSGDAAMPDRGVTLNSLISYTITNTIDITKDRGKEQTPVSGGIHAGELIIASINSNRPSQIPAALVKVEETAIEQLKPTPEKIPEFINDLLSILKEKTLSMDYIAPSNEEKLAHGNKLVKMIYDWCKEQGPLYTKQLEDLVTIATDHQSIQKCPVNLRLAEYIENSNIKESVGLKFTHERERRASKSVILNIFNDYEYHEVLSGITEVQEQYDTSVVLMIRTKNPLRPVCAMVIAIIPSSFGLYLLSFTYSTRLDHTQREYWDSTTFLMKKLHAISFKDAEGTETLKEVEDLYSQFISFFVQSCLAREIHLQRIGALGQPLI